MTDAPEKIWAYPSNVVGWGNGYFRNSPGSQILVEYIRSDLHAALQTENERLKSMLDGYGKLDVELAVAERAGASAAAKVLNHATEQKLREALRFAASRSVLSSADERRILSALTTQPAVTSEVVKPLELEESNG